MFTCIRPHLEYACQLWNPCTNKGAQLLADVQKFACKVCLKQWNLDYHSMLCLLRIIYDISTHSNYCHLLSGLQAITNLVYGRCNKLISSALCSNNSIVRMVYSVALNNCRNFVGYNRRYGYQCVRHYSVQDVTASLWLTSSVFVPGFHSRELDTLLHQACTW